MNFRDRLREQAEEVEQRRDQEQGAALQHQTYYAEVLLPRMRRAAEYFEAIVRDLNIVRPSVPATFPVGPLSDPDVLFTYGDYQFAVDDKERPHEVAVTVYAELSVPVTRQVYELRDADAFEQRLRDMGASYYRRREQDLRHQHSESSRFTTEGAISCGFRVRADAPKQQLTVETRNLEYEPRRVHQLAPERLDDDLLESLGRLLIREIPQLISSEVDDSVRERLRRGVEAQRRERARQEAQAAAEARAAGGHLQRSLESVRDSAKEVAGVVASRAATAVERYRSRDDERGE